MSDLSVLKKKILLLLLGGTAMSFSRSSKQYFRTLKIIGKEWKKINERELRIKIRQLYNSKLVDVRSKKDGTIDIVLRKKGKLRALRYKLDNMKVKKTEWDGKWRIVMFDIPEKQKSARDALRFRLSKIGLHELQKSIFISPFECKDEIDFITEFYQVCPFVRYGLLCSIDNELHLKKIFKLC